MKMSSVPLALKLVTLFFLNTLLDFDEMVAEKVVCQPQELFFESEYLWAYNNYQKIYPPTKVKLLTDLSEYMNVFKLQR